MVTDPAAASDRANLGIAVASGGLAAGALDLIYAFVLAAVSGATPVQVLHAIASGALGAAAYQGGAVTAAVGGLLHFGITLIAALVYFFIARSARVVRSHPWTCGAIFGALVYLFMNFVVVALSRVPFQIAYTPWTIVQGLVSHAVLVGLPIAVALRKFYFSRVD